MVIPEPVSRNSFLGHVSRNRRMKPWTKGVQARQKFIVRKHRLLARGGEGTQISQEGTQMGCHGSILLFSLISAKKPPLVYLSPSHWLSNNFKFYRAFSLHFFCSILFCTWRQTSLSHDILFFCHLFFCKTKILWFQLAPTVMSMLPPSSTLTLSASTVSSSSQFPLQLGNPNCCWEQGGMTTLAASCWVGVLIASSCQVPIGGCLFR